MVGIEAPGPVDRAGAEHQGAARRAVERQIVSGGGRSGRGAVVQQIWFTGSVVDDSSMRPAGRKPLSGDCIPFVAEIVLRQRRRLARLQVGDAGVAPEAQVGVVIRDGDRIASVGVDLEHGAGERILRAALRRESSARRSAGPGRCLSTRCSDRWARPGFPCRRPGCDRVGRPR